MFKQWKFRIQQYLQNEHYALWEVIEFGDSYKAPPEETGKEKRNDVKARTTLLLALSDEHQLRFSRYETAKELWEAILKTFGGNEATKKTKNNQLKQQYGNFKAGGSETLEQPLTDCRLFGKCEVHTGSVPTVSIQVSIASTDVAAASLSHDTNMALLSMRADTFWKKTGMKITIQGSDVAGFDKSKVECFNCHKMGHFARECRAPRNQDRGKRESYKQGPKEEESAPKALMAIDGIGWDWSYMANEEENHALVADEVPIEFALMAKSSSSSENEVKKEKEGLNNKLTGFESASKDLDNLLGSQRSDKNKEGLPEFVDDTVTNYSRPTPSIDASKCNTSDLQSSNFSVSEHGESSEKGKTWPKNNYAHKNVTPKAVLLKPGTTPIVVSRPNMNVAQPKMTSFAKIVHSNVKRAFQVKSTVRTQPRVPRVSIVTKKFPTVDLKFPTAKSTFTADLGNKGKVVKDNSQNNIDDKGYWDSGCSRHMTGNISYLSEYEPYDGGYVSFGQGGGKITGFRLKDDTNVLLRTPRQHNMYSIDLNNIVPHKNLTCLVAKALVDESMLWHRRLGHLNHKTMNKLVRHNLVKGLPSKCFENDHTSFACLKGKQHKASCKTKLVNSISKPLHTLHMDLFGPTSVTSLNHKWYCLVVTDDFSRCDNEGEFREFSNVKTPQQNGVAERRNKTLIEAARTMLADAKLPVTFWAEAVNTACYVQNRVLINAKGDEGYFVGYSLTSKAFRVFNKRTKKVEENMYVDFLENKLIEKGIGPNWLFDIDTLTNSMNYVPVVVTGTSSTNILGTKDVASQAMKKDVSSLRYIALPNWFHEANMETRKSDAPDGCNADVPESSGISNPTVTSKVPLADQVELAVSLTVESENPTEEPKKIFDALKDLIWVEAMQEELFQFKIQNVWILVECPKGMDVKSAFLHGTIDEEVYMMQPPGFQDPEFPDRVYKVEKAMYGLHRVPRACLQVLQKKDDIFLSQYKYVGDILKKFRYSDVRSANTPIDKENPWGKDRPGKDVELHLYRFMIESLMYLIASRPDIMFAVCACARHQVTPKECHLHAVKIIFRYLKGHPKLGLWYPKESPFNLVAYSDSDYGGATQDRKSTTRGCQFLGRRLISWQCKKQTIVATSTTEAEYVAAASGYGKVL
nr:hypothetical protein [Tanacetum cinerariifolium]